jgi:transposase
MNNFYLGIDVSKGYSDFVIVDEKKKPIEPNFQLDDTFEGHCKLYEILTEFFSKHTDCTLFAAVESTGSYENNWFSRLLDFAVAFPLKVARLNPLGVNRNSQADLKRNKTDKISAKDVAEYLIAHSEKVDYQQEKPGDTLKEQFNYIQLLNKQKVQLLNLLEIDIYKASPELMIYCKNSTPEWILHLLKLYPTATHLANTTIEELSKIPYLSAKKAKLIIKRANTSVASAVDEMTADRIIDLVEDILTKNEQIAKQKSRLQQHKNVLSEKVALLKTVKGIGTYSAVGLLIHIVNVERFAASKNISSFFGIHPIYKQSGDGVWGYHMSKKGDVMVRNILYMVTLSAIRCNPLIKEIYARNVAKGKEKKDAMGVCMHKILRIVYGMLKNNTEFDPDIDRQNQKRQYSSSEKLSKDKSRRYQNHDSEAPISSRQTKKRKEQAQNDNIKNINNLKKFVPNLQKFYMN